MKKHLQIKKPGADYEEYVIHYHNGTLSHEQGSQLYSPPTCLCTLPTWKYTRKASLGSIPEVTFTCAGDRGLESDSGMAVEYPQNCIPGF